MHGGRTRTVDNTVPRRKTRSQFDLEILNRYNEMKRQQRGESIGNASENKRDPSCIGSESTSVDGDDFFGNDDSKKSSSGTRLMPMTRTGVRKCFEKDDNDGKTMMGVKHDKNVASSSPRGLRKKKKLCVKSDGGDDDLMCLGKKYVLNYSSLRIGRECSTTDGSDESSEEIESESSSEDDDDVETDEDYEGDESSSSEDSKDSYCSDDFEKEKDTKDCSSDDNKDDGCSLVKDCDEGNNGGEKMNVKMEIDDDSGGMKTSYNQQKMEEDDVIIIDDKEMLPSVRWSERNKKNEECVSGNYEQVLSSDPEDEASNDGDRRGTGICNNRSVEQKEEKDAMIFIEEEERLPRVRRSARVKGNVDYCESSRKRRIHEQVLSSGSKDERSGGGDSRGTSPTSSNARKKVDDDFGQNGSKKRKLHGLEILVDCGKSRFVENGDDKGSSKMKKLRGLEILVYCGRSLFQEKVDNEGSSKTKKLRGLEILVDCGKSRNGACINEARTKHIHPRSSVESQKEKIELGKRDHPIGVSDIKEHDSPTDESSDDNADLNVVRGGTKYNMEDSKREANCRIRNYDMVKVLMDSITDLREGRRPIIENVPSEDYLPLRFKFEEDEVVPPKQKSEWENEMDSLFHELEFCLRQSEADSDNSPPTKEEVISPLDIDSSPAACCSRGEHQPILDEQIGIICKYCSDLILEIKYVLPDFYTPPIRSYDRKDFDELSRSVMDELHFHGSSLEKFAVRTKGTVWDLIGGVPHGFYPHQCDGFEFMWKNIAGSIDTAKLKGPLSNGGKGCIMAHAPGTGKTRLALVFLQSFLKLYPNSCPVLVAPKGMLPNWENEFLFWKIDVPFHNLSNEDLSGKEIVINTNVFGKAGDFRMNREYIRLVKLYSWMKGGSVLGISYQMFQRLTRGEGSHAQIARVLQEVPSVLVLDEGHTPRNDHSHMWKAFCEVVTRRFIVLSGTPFQNNCKELRNTLRLVDPEFGEQRQRDWKDLTSSIGKSNKIDGVEELRALLEPFVHRYEGTILNRLPGLKNTIVFLHPTELQESLLGVVTNAKYTFFDNTHMVSLISVHPSTMAGDRRFAVHKSKLEDIKLDLDEGVKLKFLMRLIWLADALGERVLVFSQYVAPLVFIKKQLKSHFAWDEGKQVLHMDGGVEVRRRQESISALNDPTSEAKVLLATLRACSEGINLVGASRVVLLDTVWNPSVEKQAISRAYRIGQKKMVYVYRLITRTEVRQYELQSRKGRLSELIFSPLDVRSCEKETSSSSSSLVSEDKVLDAMLNEKSFSNIIGKIIYNPKKSDLIDETFDIVDGL